MNSAPSLRDLRARYQALDTESAAADHVSRLNALTALRLIDAQLEHQAETKEVRTHVAEVRAAAAELKAQHIEILASLEKIDKRLLTPEQLHALQREFKNNEFWAELGRRLAKGFKGVVGVSLGVAAIYAVYRIGHDLFQGGKPPYDGGPE